LVSGSHLSSFLSAAFLSQDEKIYLFSPFLSAPLLSQDKKEKKDKKSKKERKKEKKRCVNVFLLLLFLS
jgi:hypothetical protein